MLCRRWWRSCANTASRPSSGTSARAANGAAVDRPRRPPARCRTARRRSRRPRSRAAPTASVAPRTHHEAHGGDGRSRRGTARPARRAGARRRRCGAQRARARRRPPGRSRTTSCHGICTQPAGPQLAGPMTRAATRAPARAATAIGTMASGSANSNGTNAELGRVGEAERRVEPHEHREHQHCDRHSAPGTSEKECGGREQPKPERRRQRMRRRRAVPGDAFARGSCARCSRSTVSASSSCSSKLGSKDMSAEISIRNRPSLSNPGKTCRFLVQMSRFLAGGSSGGDLRRSDRPMRKPN